MRREGDRLVLQGDINVETVPSLLSASEQHVREGVSVIDFGVVGEVDSSAIALALEWLREARAAGRTLAFANLPASMQNLASLYDVSDFLAPQR